MRSALFLFPPLSTSTEEREPRGGGRRTNCYRPLSASPLPPPKKRRWWWPCYREKLPRLIRRSGPFSSFLSFLFPTRSTPLDTEVRDGEGVGKIVIVLPSLAPDNGREEEIDEIEVAARVRNSPTQEETRRFFLREMGM